MIKAKLQIAICISVMLFLIGILSFYQLTETQDDQKDVIVAVIDTEYCDGSFSEESVWINENELANNGEDDDLNGYADDFLGWNFCKNKAQEWTDNKFSTHGTAVVYAMMDEIGNRCGIKLMLLTALNDEGTGNIDNIVDAIHYAEENGARICNLSFASFVQYKSLEETIEKSKMLFIVPAGNYGMELTETFECYPASYNCKNLITVGAVDDEDKLLDCSNYGAEYVDVYCNGVITINGEQFEGTSIACARQSVRCSFEDAFGNAR